MPGVQVAESRIGAFEEEVDGAGRTMALLGDDNLGLVLDGFAALLPAPVAVVEMFFFLVGALHRLFAGMRPFWGKEEGGVRFTAIRSDVKPTLGAVPGILRGRPNAFVTPERGVSSLNARRVEIQLDCGLTIAGEQIAPEIGRIVSITADSIVRFVRS